MSTDPIRRFIASHIVSVEQLEILLLLRAEQVRSWTVDQVNDRIRSSRSSVATRLADLERRGLLVMEGDGFRYRSSNEHEPVLAELARVYVERRYSVIDMIFGKTTDTMQAFADAFKVRRRDDDG